MNKIRFFNLIAALALVVAALPLAQNARAEGSPPNLARDMQFVPGEAVVSFQSGQDAATYTAQAAALADTVGAQVVEQNDNLALMSFAPDADVAAVVKDLAEKSGVAFAEPNYVAFSPDTVSATAIPVTTVDRRTTGGETFTMTADTLRAMRTSPGGSVQAVPTYPNDFSSNWSWVKISTDIIWPDKSRNPTVCVVDTGVDAYHADLKGKVVKGPDYVNGDRIPNDDNGHGTHVAGTISARLNNGAATVAGISTAKILAVKVLNSQGLGTSFGIASGIQYCADKGAKIINLSLGGYGASQAEYDALNYAENARGLLVVAAAGNDSTSDFFFPAAWASSNVCKDGTAGPCGTGNENSLAPGLIAVAAARSLQTLNNDSSIWVDSDGDGLEVPAEDVADCATYFSNFGDWVSMVAPGEDILSTTPTSNPFYMNYTDGVPYGYAALSGTSMAAAHVAGAAARVWSIGVSLFGTPTAANVKNQLINMGAPLNIVDDPNASGGYGDGGFAGNGPFCWPSSMSSSSYLNVADAMQRMSIGAVLALDANTGLPLSGAKVMVNALGSARVLDTAMVSTTTPFVDLLNIPANTTRTFELKVHKARYTTGTTTIGQIVVDPSMAGSVWSGDNLSIAVPQIDGISVVATWFNKQAYMPVFGAGAKRDLDFYMWAPANGLTTYPSTNTKAIVGPKLTLWNSPGTDSYTSLPTLFAPPFARSFLDGGSGDPSLTVATPVGVETINIRQNSKRPRLLPRMSPYYAGDYIFILTGRDSGKLTNDDQYLPVVSVWIKGVRYTSVALPVGCSGNAWKALTINYVTYTLGNDAVTSCGDFSEQPTGLWPYH
jgi:subtilisin family serine protease